MNILTINQECSTAEISLYVEEILVIFKACATIDLGFAPSEYEIVFNTNRAYIKKLLEELDSFYDLLNMKRKDISHFKIKEYDSKKKLIFIEVGVLQIKSMGGALSQIPINLYEEDCSIVLGISWEEFLCVRHQILNLIYELKSIDGNLIKDAWIPKIDPKDNDETRTAFFNAAEDYNNSN